MATSWAPEPSVVAARLPQRLVGVETFNDDTVPTEAQAQEVIDQAVQDVVAAVGSFDPAAIINEADVERGEDPVTLGDLAASAATLDAAAQIELGFFPEQVQGGEYEALNDRAKAALARLEEAVIEYRAGGVGSGRTTPKPKFSFPAPEWPPTTTVPRLPL